MKDSRGTNQVDRHRVGRAETKIDLDPPGEVTQPMRSDSEWIWTCVAMVRKILRGPLILALFLWAGSLVYLDLTLGEGNFFLPVGLVAVSALLATIPYLIRTNGIAVVACRLVIVLNAFVLVLVGVLIEWVGRALLGQGTTMNWDLGPSFLIVSCIALGVALLAYAASTRPVRQKLT